MPVLVSKRKKTELTFDITKESLSGGFRRRVKSDKRESKVSRGEHSDHYFSDKDASET